MDRLLTAETVVVASSEQVHRMLGDEAVILELRKGTYFGVDDVGARIWERLQQPVTVAALRDAIVAEYEVTAEQAEQDLLAFLGELLEHALIEVRGAP
jgi:hypothetical protein